MALLELGDVPRDVADVSLEHSVFLSQPSYPHKHLPLALLSFRLRQSGGVSSCFLVLPLKIFF